MLSRLKFAGGATPGAEGLEVTPSTVIVFVGPNNSGKSLALREIEAWCIGGDEVRSVVEEIEFNLPVDADEAATLLGIFEMAPPAGHSPAEEHIFVGQHTFRAEEPFVRQQVHVSSVRQAAAAHNINALRQTLLRFYTVRLDGRTRFALAEPKPSGDLQDAPQNHLWALFQSDESRARVRNMTDEAFGLHFVIDPTAMTQFRIRMSSRAPVDGPEEQGLDARTRAFHRQAELVGNLSDGVQAFTGLVSAVMSLPHRIMLVDEPEAFLHPPLARRLGSDLASLARTRRATLIVATHSAEFLSGCLESEPSTTIIRLGYDAGVASARTLAAAELRRFTRSPLLRSTRAFGGLFHRAVIATESDTDRAFYDEINRRLVESARGVQDALFINAQNWQTTPEVLLPLRRLGVPAAAIVDLDAIRGDGAEWSKFYRLMSLADATRTAVGQARATSKTALDAVPMIGGVRAFKVKGINALPVADRPQLRTLIADLAKYGVFVVPVGELERWLPKLAIEGQKVRWVIDAFKKLGDDPGNPAYVKPGVGDVWRFLDAVARWTSDPLREGMPG